MKLNINDCNKNEVNQSQRSVNKVETPTNAYKEEPMMYSSAGAIVENNVLFQIEYHFSDENLIMDNYLLSRMHEDPGYWVSVKTVANLTKIKALTNDERVTLNAIRKSKMLILNEDESKVKRPGFEPPKPKPHKDLRRTVFIYGLPFEVTKEDIIRLCSCYGVIKAIALDILRSASFDVDDSIDKALFAESDDIPTSIKINLKTEKTEKEEREEEEEGREEDHHDSAEDTEDGVEEEEEEEEEIEPPDRETAEVVMMRKFGPRVNPIDRQMATVPRKENDGAFSNSFNNTNGECANVSNGGMATTPPFPHPILYSSGNPCDYSRLRTAFVVFKSQSQANKCVRGRMRSSDGIRAMHQYDFNKQRKKTSVNKARGMSPLLLHQNHSVDHPFSSSRGSQFRLPNPLLEHQSPSNNSSENRYSRSISQRIRDPRTPNNRRNRDHGFSAHKRFSYPRLDRNEHSEVSNVSFPHARSYPFYKHHYCSPRDLSTKRPSDSTNWRHPKKSRNDLFDYPPQTSDNESMKQTMAIGPDSGSKGFNWPRNHRTPRGNSAFGTVVNTVPVLTTPVFSYHLISGTGSTLGVVAMPIASLTFPTATPPMMYTQPIGNISATNK